MSIAKIFNSDCTAFWKTIPKCVVCFTEFSVRNNFNSRNRPLILSCYHNVCEKCVAKNCLRPIECPECNEKTTIYKAKPLGHSLEINHFLNGLVFYMNSTFNHPNLALNLTNNEFFANNERGKKFDGSYECSECNINFTKSFCIQCSVPYCTQCFNDVHKNGKTLQKHVLSKFEPDHKNLLPKYKNNTKCKFHKKIECNKYCQSCKVTICDHCVAVGHQNHIIVSLQSERKKYLMQIDHLIQTVKMAINANNEAIKNSKYVQQKYNEYSIDAIEFVSKYYAKLHSILQISETKTLMKIKEKFKHSSFNQIKQTQKTFENTAKQLDDLINTLEKIVKENPTHLLPDIIEKSHSILESIPCQVDFKNFENCPFTLNPKDLKYELENCVEFQSDNEDNPCVELRTFFGDVSQNCDSTDSENVEKIISNYENYNDKMIKPNEIIIKDNCQVKREKNYKKKLSKPKKIDIQNVFVSYIKNPHEFYVQKEAFYLKLSEFQKCCHSEGEISITPDYIEVNEIYLVKSNNIWCRGRILKSTKSKNAYNVFLIDTGETSQIPKQCIRVISNDIRNFEQETLKCSIFGIKSKTDEWTDEAIKMMNEIVSNQICQMIQINEEKNVCEVDLITNQNNFPTSTREALIFTDVADEIKFNENDQKFNKNLHIFKEMKRKLIPAVTKCLCRTVLTNGVYYRIVPLKVNHPKEFYVTKYESISEIELLSKEMNQEYLKNELKIFKPRKNMPCAVFVKGKWYRGRILDVESKVNCKIWLVDYGVLEIVNWLQIRILYDKFLKNSEFAYECSLIDIDPLQSNNYTWTVEAISEFKKIMRNSILHIFLHKTEDFWHKTTLLIIKKTCDINVNALMVEYNFATSTGPESLNVKQQKCINDVDFRSINKNTFNQQLDNSESVEQFVPKIELYNKSKKNSYRSKIIVTNIISPGEFYIQLQDQKHLNAFKKLDKEIQETQNKKLECKFQDRNELNWTLNESCLVLTGLLKNQKKIQWHRAKITHINDQNNTYTVFLIDYGDTIHNINYDQISQIDEIFNRICDTAIKCHLACVRPTGGLEKWSDSSIDQLKEIIEKYDNICASIQGNRTDNSIPVILWGVINECSDALLPNICKWININQLMVNFGLAHLYEKFIKADQELIEINKKVENDKWFGLVNAIDKVDNVSKCFSLQNTSGDVFDNSDNSEDIKNFESWLSPIPIGKTMFTGIPTYVDNDAIIYLHDATNQSLLNKIDAFINNKFKDYNKSNFSSLNWNIGQPCIALYHLDNKYYRAEIIDIKSNNKIKVCFVDYGNIESCEPENLINDVCLLKIPMQSRKYKLNGIVSNTENGIWTRDTLDILHLLIVMKMCVIRVIESSQNDLIKKCSICTEFYNIADYLIENNYAKKEPLEFNKIVLKDVIREFLSSSENSDNETNNNESDDETDILQRVANLSTNDTKKIMHSDDYKKMFEKQELENLYKSIMFDKEQLDENESEKNLTFLSGNWHKNLTASISSNEEKNENIKNKNDIESISSFNPKDTSTVISRFDSMDMFSRSQLPFGITGFYCEIISIRSSTNFIINPLLKENKIRCVDLTFKLQMFAKTAKPLETFEPNTPCLAVYKEDGQWYRAKILSFCPYSNKVNVVFVDFLNSEEVSIMNIRKCPQQLLEYPLRLIEIKLGDLRPNHRWRSLDIMRSLSKILDGKTIYAKILKEGILPEVQFQESENNNNLILQKLIDDRLFLLTS